MKKFFKYLQNPSFEIASDAQATFKELLTRHKSTVAEYLSTDDDWFFQEYNSKLLESTNYITRRQAVRLLGDILEFLGGSNSAVKDRYVGSLHSKKVVMNLLKDANRHIQLESFNVFKLFVANQREPNEIVRNILQANRRKLLEFLGDFYFDRVDDDEFEADKRKVIREIITVKC
ncbi:Mo25 family protein [Melia azedarach]|uniref:Mo25 family protein n=1 Tax=Melia azedarach TaxID=155640 RepID=A0ACC1Z1J3_MELAZ|nr:Mo25 family protein [Melia azedarach]